MFTLVWQQNDAIVRDSTINGSVAFPVGFPGTTSKPLRLAVRSSALDAGTFESLKNVKIYLTGTDVELVQNTWPTLGGLSRPEISGGLEISFDGGRTYQRFSLTVGLESDPGTWLSLPKEAIGSYGLDETARCFRCGSLNGTFCDPTGCKRVQDLRRQARS
jgi:hypothetical protein